MKYNIKYKVGFVCVHNSARSQMAEGLAKKLGGDFNEYCINST